jgi:opacity protein-like surface antigen
MRLSKVQEMRMKWLLFVTIAAVGFATAASAAQPKVAGAVHQISEGCLALDATGATFVDPAARQQALFTPSGNVNIVCQGHLMPAAVLPPAEVSFTEKSGTGFTCLARFEETIEVDGSFTLVCHSKAK